MPRTTLEIADGPHPSPAGRPQPSGDEPALVLSGIGPRSWRGIEPVRGARKSGSNWELPRRAIAQTAILRLGTERRTARSHSVRLLRWLDTQLDRGLGVAGYVGYEVGAALEDIPLAPSVENGRSGPPAAELVAFAPDDLVQAPSRDEELRGQGPRFMEQVRQPDALTRHERAFVAAVGEVLERIAAGDVYQLNLTVGFDVPAPRALSEGCLRTLAALTQTAQAVPYGFALDGPQTRVISGSMERFVTIGDGRIRSRPIKGSAPRTENVDGVDGAEGATEGVAARSDAAIRQTLLASSKERAENAMIVDMVRNDLSRVAELGSVRVVELLKAQKYRTIWHLESEVEGRLLPGTRMSEWLTATLPPASVTGCPKIAAMRLITDLERRRRGPYCGALGVSIGHSCADWSVGIRLLTVDRRVPVNESRAWIDVGAGIVADSEPRSEWRETCAKAASALALVAAAKHLTASGHGAHGANGPLAWSTG